MSYLLCTTYEQIVLFKLKFIKHAFIVIKFNYLNKTLFYHIFV